ncbi:helix-turn-helix transcriptional regulator [Streptomyces sp. NPDC048254]|uniref:helix-turn-helix transcriptional regulator n=1 Tax=Streptomyces sp. NPDC048254 TaxID=3365525 RepID=UPI0037214D8D
MGRPAGPGHRQGSTIAAMAHRWGVTSAAHFSRVFRAACGVSPVNGATPGSSTLKRLRSFSGHLSCVLRQAASAAGF